MTILHFAEAMLPQGWARDVRVTIADGVIARVETGAAAQAGDERHRVALPGMPNLHSHAFQRGMAGLAEVAGLRFSRIDRVEEDAPVDAQDDAAIEA